MTVSGAVALSLILAVLLDAGIGVDDATIDRDRDVAPRHDVLDIVFDSAPPIDEALSPLLVASDR
jgi:hypothetical protein